MHRYKVKKIVDKALRSHRGELLRTGNVHYFYSARCVCGWKTNTSMSDPSVTMNAVHIHVSSAVAKDINKAMKRAEKKRLHQMIEVC